MFVTCVCSGRDLQLMQNSGSCREHVFFFFGGFVSNHLVFFVGETCVPTGGTLGALGKLWGSFAEAQGRSGAVLGKFQESFEKAGKLLHLRYSFSLIGTVARLNYSPSLFFITSLIIVTQRSLAFQIMKEQTQCVDVTNVSGTTKGGWRRTFSCNLKK